MLWPRWIWLRALGLIFLSAFYSLAFQIEGLNGPRGILPAGECLPALREAVGQGRALWYAPTLFWLGSSDAALLTVVLIGAAASVLLTLNLAPGGLRPGLAAASPPPRFAAFLLLWEWLRIYFESGIVKILSGDPQWRALTALDHYYENGPLPSWIGWYVQQWLPHGFHAFTVGIVFAVELLLVWLALFPRPFRLAVFLLVSPFQAAIILTANYAFLNYIVLWLGVWLLDDPFLHRIGLPLPSPVPPPHEKKFFLFSKWSPRMGPLRDRGLGARAVAPAAGDPAASRGGARAISHRQPLRPVRARASKRRGRTNARDRNAVVNPFRGQAHPLRMTGRVLSFLLLASAAARADKAWVFEPGQALVSIELGPSRARLSLTSLGMSGRVVELTDGGVEANVRVRLASFTTGTAARDAQVRRDSAAANFPEVVFEGTAPGAGKDGALLLDGTLTFHGVSRLVSVPVTMVRAAGMTFGHVQMTLHLRDFGFAVPDSLADEVRVEVDAGLRPEGAIASRG